MTWADLFPLLALSATTLAMVAVAIAVAAVLRLDRRWFGRASPLTPAQTIDRLASLADTAKSRGLLAAESEVDAAREPLLAKGLRLAVDGAPANEISQRLQEEAAAAEAHPSWVSRLLRIPGLAQTHALAAGVLLVLMLTNRTEPDLMPAGPAAAAALSFLVLAAIGSFAAASRPQTAATEALASTMQIVAAALIGGGCDGRGVRSQLSALLPPSQRPSAAISQAA